MNGDIQDRGQLVQAIEDEISDVVSDDYEDSLPAVIGWPSDSLGYIRGYSRSKTKG